MPWTPRTLLTISLVAPLLVLNVGFRCAASVGKLDDPMTQSLNHPIPLLHVASDLTYFFASAGMLANPTDLVPPDLQYWVASNLNVK
jgi:hypothetical protein